jgi:Ribonuclease G/E
LPEWLIERGIGETRVVLVEDGRIVEARIMLDGVVPAGTVIAAKLASVGANGRNAIARGDDGAEYLLPHAPRGVTEGAPLKIQITREAIPGNEAWKRPLARMSDAPPSPAPSPEGRVVPFPSPGKDPLEAAGWSDLLEEAASGIVEFPGGRLRISPTPAMVLIDVDGTLPAEELAIAGARAAGQAIRRLGLAGSIGIDLPTVQGKAARQAAGEAIDAVLPQPFERTAVNGFGFVQIIHPRSRASLVELYAGDRVGAEARALLRRAASETGARRLAGHPAVIAVLERHLGWIDALAAQVGGAISLRADPSLPMSGAYAEPA